MNSQQVKEYLNDRGIKFEVFTHPAVYTCEQAEEYNQKVKGIHSKNLFLKDRKSKNFYLIILPADKKLEIKEIEDKLNNKLKFANETDLKDILELEKGAVSPFGLINDKEIRTTLVIDKDILDSEFVSFHPNINTETLEISKQDFH
jgi:Ala-tRNA(Pro) deacylase